MGEVIHTETVFADGVPVYEQHHPRGASRMTIGPAEIASSEWDADYTVRTGRALRRPRASPSRVVRQVSEYLPAWPGLRPPYATVVVDPPWRVHQPPVWTSGPNRALPYSTMHVDEIRSLQVADLAAADAHLYLWTINRYVEAAYDVARRWGFEPSTLLTWCKRPIGLGPGGAYALTTEHVLFARRGRGAFVERHPTTWWQWDRGEHSEKPAAFLDIVERVSPGPYVELFARAPRLGWDSWGKGYELGATA